MKWFKHDSNASIDAKLKRVRLKYGMEGYGLYWYCLELIAQTVEIHNLSFELEHDAELIAMDTGINQERVQDMMSDLVKWGLFENNHGVVTCLKMASRTDEYTSKLLRTYSRPAPDKIPPNRIEEKRVEQKRTEQKPSPPKETVDLPEWLDLKAWSEFEQHRKETKKPLTPLAARKNLSVLEKHKDRQAEIIDTTISNRWTGLFEPKGRINEESTRSRAKQLSDKLDNIAREDVEANGFPDFGD